MIDLYFWPTPNGYKPLIMLEEAGLEYSIKPVNIMRGDQFEPDFLKISPNNRMPAMVDHENGQNLFESGAILFYLAEKSGKFMPTDGQKRHEVMQWVMWQMGGLGPMMGQANHFVKYASEDVPYGKKRYLDETKRLIGVYEKVLAFDTRPYIAGEYSIADMMSYPWLKGAEILNIEMDAFPHVNAWRERMASRDAVQRAYEVGAPVSENFTMDEEAKKHLYGTK